MISHNITLEKLAKMDRTHLNRRYDVSSPCFSPTYHLTRGSDGEDGGTSVTPMNDFCRFLRSLHVLWRDFSPTTSFTICFPF